MLVGLQSCAVMVGGSVTEDTGMSGGGAAGIIIALLFVLGAAFAIGLPRVSLVMFGLAAMIGLGVGASTPFKDMTIWGIISAVLAVLSYFGVRELSKRKPDTTPPGAHS